MRRLQESGILRQLYFNVLRPPVPQPLPKVRKNEPLNMEQLGTAAIVASFGFVIGSIAFLGELCLGGPTASRNQLPKDGCSFCCC